MRDINICLCQSSIAAFTRYSKNNREDGTRVGDRQCHTPAGCLQWRIHTTPLPLSQGLDDPPASPYLKVWIRHCSVHLTPCKGIQDSLGFWISRRGFRIPVTGFQYLSVELGSWIPIVSGIPDSLSSIPHSKTQDSGFHTLTWGDTSLLSLRVTQRNLFGEEVQKKITLSTSPTNRNEF